MRQKNLILKTDTYKFSHFMQYPPGTENVYSYIEARGSNVEGCNLTVMAGLHPWIVQNLMKPITLQDVERAKVHATRRRVHFNEAMWLHILEHHQGYMPVEIRAVPEGTVVPTGHMLLSIRALDPKCAALVSYLETAILRAIWYATTVASISRHAKTVAKKYLDFTSDNADACLPYMLNDFGARGVSSEESGELGGFGHIISFNGTDNDEALDFAAHYYGADISWFPGVAASEHSTMTSWGRAGEIDAYRNMVNSYASEGSLFACVIDSYDDTAAINMWLTDPGLLPTVKAAGSRVVLRPDSGHPINNPIAIVEQLLEGLASEVTVNSKGFKVLPSYVRVLQGDGIDIVDMETILDKLMDRGISAENIVFGMGGGLLQKVNRDNFKFAMKCSAIEINHKTIDVYKDPKAGGKKSKLGRIDLYHNRATGEYKTLRYNETLPGYTIATETMYYAKNGTVHVNAPKFSDIRNRAEVK